MYKSISNHLVTCPSVIIQLHVINQCNVSVTYISLSVIIQLHVISPSVIIQLYVISPSVITQLHVISPLVIIQLHVHQSISNHPVTCPSVSCVPKWWTAGIIFDFPEPTSAIRRMSKWQEAESTLLPLSPPFAILHRFPRNEKSPGFAFPGNKKKRKKRKHPSRLNKNHSWPPHSTTPNPARVAAFFQSTSSFAVNRTRKKNI
ncbi:hypothetical protein CDAR_391321 [Caerostris darwini]|uniref:Uncharacterized protein n=1 Tax=Caerostris darwini TaxID=1538125 RepID=A0AAV4W7P4_9ARAC|nr:hypothetical protein CDAR_391321 [Caerostris darwini]